MIDFKINADASKADYHKIIEFIEKKVNESRSKIKKLGFKAIDNNFAKKILLKLIKSLNKILCDKSSQFVKKNMSADIIIKTFDLKFKGEIMNIRLDCSIDNLNDILSFVESKFNLKDENLKSIIISSIRAVKEIVDDDSKLKLIDYVLNDSSEEIYRYLSKLISDKMFQIQIDNIEFETKNNIEE